MLSIRFQVCVMLAAPFAMGPTLIGMVPVGEVRAPVLSNVMVPVATEVVAPVPPCTSLDGMVTL